MHSGCNLTKIIGDLKSLQIVSFVIWYGAIVGTLLEVGRGRMSVEDFRKVITVKKRCSAGESVAGNALFLVDIQY